MIATLHGIVEEKLADSLIVATGGLGYELAVTADDWGAAVIGEERRYYVYEQIREDVHNLYGFGTRPTRALFSDLIGINGVGPKVAMAILSAAGETRLRQALASGDADLLKGVSGVGPKTAQRIILELRGRVESDSRPVSDSTYQALVALGYTPVQAAMAVAAISPELTDEQARVKAALKQLAR